MIEKFKSLSKGKKIIVGVLAFILLPIVLLALGVELLLKGIKAKKIGKAILGAFLAISMITPSLSILNLYSISTMISGNDRIQKEAVETVEENGIAEQENQNDNEVENKNIFGTIMEKPVMNGYKTERIGTYAEVMAGGIEITKENLIQFYKEVVKNSSYNWVTLNIDGESGINFHGSSYFFTYGTIDDEGCIIESKGEGFITENGIEYE